MNKKKTKNCFNQIHYRREHRKKNCLQVLTVFWICPSYPNRTIVYLFLKNTVVYLKPIKRVSPCRFSYHRRDLRKMTVSVFIKNCLHDLGLVLIFPRRQNRTIVYFFRTISISAVKSFGVWFYAKTSKNFVQEVAENFVQGMDTPYTKFLTIPYTKFWTY